MVLYDVVPPAVDTLPTDVSLFLKSIIVPLVLRFMIATVAVSLVTANRPSFLNSIPTLAVSVEVLPTNRLPDESILAFSVPPPEVNIKFWLSVFIIAAVVPDSLNLSIGVSVVSVSFITISALSPSTTRALSGESVPIPTFPDVLSMVKYVSPLSSVISKFPFAEDLPKSQYVVAPVDSLNCLLFPPSPRTSRIDVGEVVPMPTR